MKNIKFMTIIYLLVGFSMISLAGKTSKISIKTSGQCGMCKEKIETAVNKINGVSSTYFNEANSKVLVKYDATKTNPDAIRQVISKIGYDADNISADKAGYEALPDCCKKGVVCKH